LLEVPEAAGLLALLDKGFEGWDAIKSIEKSLAKLLKFPDGPLQLFYSLIFHSSDPNEKIAPAGYGDAAFVQADGSLAYTVGFENQPCASAPAQTISVNDSLDPDLDLDTFQLTEIAFGGQRISVPAGLDNYTTTLPIQANGTTLQVQVNA